MKPMTLMKLLIVEDNPQMRQMIRTVVADLVETIAECADGEAQSAREAEERRFGFDPL